MFAIADIAARWANGKTYAQYYAALEIGRAATDHIAQEAALTPEERAAFGAMATPLRALVVTEDWCPDSALNLPVLMKVVEAHPSLDVRFAGREENWDVLAHVKKGERMAIPTVLFFDAEWNLAGYWVERSLSVDALLDEYERGRTPPTEPDRTAPVWREYRKGRMQFYQDELFLKRGLWRKTVAELRAILSGAVTSNVAALDAAR